MSYICCICGEEMTRPYRQMMGKTYICKTCYVKSGRTAGFFSNPVDVSKRINEREHKKHSTKVGGRQLLINKESRTFFYYQESNQYKGEEISFDDLLDFQVLADEGMVFSGGSGDAFVGGLLFGPIGAIAGGITGRRKGKGTVSNIKVKLIFKDITKKPGYINIYPGKLTQGGWQHSIISSRLEEITAALTAILFDQKNMENQSEIQPAVPSIPEPSSRPEQSSSKVDQIQKMFELLQAGAITQKEYEQLKKEILS